MNRATSASHDRCHHSVAYGETFSFRVRREKWNGTNIASGRRSLPRGTRRSPQRRCMPPCLLPACLPACMLTQLPLARSLSRQGCAEKQAVQHGRRTGCAMSKSRCMLAPLLKCKSRALLRSSTRLACDNLSWCPRAAFEQRVFRDRAILALCQ